MLRLHIRREGRNGAGRRQQSETTGGDSATQTEEGSLPTSSAVWTSLRCRELVFARSHLLSDALSVASLALNAAASISAVFRYPRVVNRAGHRDPGACGLITYAPGARIGPHTGPGLRQCQSCSADSWRIMLTGTHREATTAEQQTPQSRHVEPRFVTPAAMLVVRMHSVQGTYTGALSTAIVSVETQRNSGYCQAIWTTVSFVRPSLTNSAAVAGLLSVTELVSVLGDNRCEVLVRTPTGTPSIRSACGEFNEENEQGWTNACPSRAQPTCTPQRVDVLQLTAVTGNITRNLAKTDRNSTI